MAIFKLPQVVKNSKGELSHLGVVAIIKNEGGKYLLLKRRIYPWGYAFVSGHVNKDESIEEALRREIKEEIGVDLKSYRFLFKIEQDQRCIMLFYKQVNYVYECFIEKAEIKKNFESSSVNWYTPEEMKKLKLSDSPKEIAEKLGII